LLAVVKHGAFLALTAWGSGTVIVENYTRIISKLPK
jgi:hypothetical protein